MHGIAWWAVALGFLAVMCSQAYAETRRDVFIDPLAEPGGDGSREKPYASMQEMVDNHEADWGQAFLQPGVYREDVNIHRGRFWFFPAQQYGVVLEGSITVRMPGTKIRGLVVRSEGSAVTLAEGATGCEIQHCRITELGEGAAGIDIAGPGVSGALINGNVIELEEGADRAGIRATVGPGVTGNHIDHNRLAGCETGIALLGADGAQDQLNTITGNRLFGCGIDVEGYSGRTKMAWNEVDGEIDSDPFADAASRAHEPRTVHVAPAAEGGGSGTPDDPFAGLGLALQDAGPGDVILMAPGEYPANNTISAIGTANSPITIRPSKPGSVTVGGAVWKLEYAAHVRIEGIRFSEPSGYAVTLGPYCRNCEIVGNEVVREAEGGAGGMAVAGPSSSRNLFEGNVIRLNHGGVGIQVYCQRYNWHLTMRGNDISGCYYGIQTGGGSYPTAPPGYHIIEDNDLHHNWKEGFHSKTTDNIIRSNRVYENDGYGLTTRYGSRNVFVGNWVYHNGHGIRLHSKSHFLVNNLIFENGGNGIYLGSWPGDKEGRFPYSFEPYYEPPHEVWIAHNTIADNGGAPIFADNGTQLMALRNIFVGTGSDAPAIRFAEGGVARQVEQNLYWNARPPLLCEYEGGEVEVLADPKFLDRDNDDFRLADDSPARDVTPLGDALSFVLSSQPAGIALADHIGANLPPPQAD